MKKQDILAIVDVQEFFNPPPHLIEAILPQIELARRTGIHIAVVELRGSIYGDKSSTVPALMGAVIGLDYSRVYKERQAGGKEILEEMKVREIEPGIVTCVGLYTRACLRDTVKELREFLSVDRVNVVPKATWTEPWLEEFIEEPHLRQTPQEGK